jgi:putative glycosyltransferase (TIGR04348 family)
MSRPSVVIVSPALAAANNGNWRTARRWQQFLADDFAVRILQEWPDAQANDDDVLLALHARRSAPAIQAWAQVHAGRGLGLVLTGTDLYQDLAVDVAAQRSLELAQRVVVLQECGVQDLPPAHRAKARVIFQSTPARPAVDKPADGIDAVVVGHLRQVKAPQTVFAAARLLRESERIRITQIGNAEAEPALGDAARATQRECPHYTWAGALPHEQVLERIRHANVLVHPSVLEGGAHVILEAACQGTPVLASRVPGNVGMLGADYAGYFAAGDAAALAGLLRACCAGQSAQDPAAGLLGRLAAQCSLRTPLFAPERERASLLRLVHELLNPP